MQQIEGDARFWSALGTYKSFLDRLWGHARAPIRNTGAVEQGMRFRGECTERCYFSPKNGAEGTRFEVQNEISKTLQGEAIKMKKARL